MKLELRGISKQFGSVRANRDISLVVEEGTTHALLGENGAGKSTLMNILYGLYQPDAGTILLDDREVTFAGAADALAAGIGMVHQHFMLVPNLTVAENVMLGREWTTSFGLLSRRAAAERVRELSDRYGLKVDPDAFVEDLPVGIQQRVEIIKALAHEAKVLILDEPTAVLTPPDVDDLLRVIGELKAGGTSIVFISHKLREVQRVADTITVIRRGEVVGRPALDATESELAREMVGREVSLARSEERMAAGDPVLVVDRLAAQDDRGQDALLDADFVVRAGEIVCVAGVQGNGQEQLVEALLGLRAVSSGTVTIAGRDRTGCTPAEILSSGVGFVPEDRKLDGLVGSFSIADNLVLDRYRDREFATGPVRDLAAITGNATSRISEFDIRAASPQVSAATLSGGNQQKVVLARELSRPLTVLVASQPTRGVDVGAQELIYERLLAERNRGTAVLIVSTELDEIRTLADRIIVIFRGRFMGELPGTASREEIGLLMAGIAPATPLASSSHASPQLGDTESLV